MGDWAGGGEAGPDLVTLDLRPGEAAGPRAGGDPAHWAGVEVRLVSCQHSTGPWMVAAVLTTNSSMMTVLVGGIIVSLLLKCNNSLV